MQNAIIFLNVFNFLKKKAGFIYEKEFISLFGPCSTDVFECFLYQKNG